MIPNLNEEEVNNLLDRTRGKRRISGFIGESIAYEVLVRGLDFNIYHPPSFLFSQSRKSEEYEKSFWGDKYDSIKEWGWHRSRVRPDIVIKKDYPADLIIKKGNDICFVEVKSNTARLYRVQKEELKEMKKLGFRVGVLKVKFKIDYYGIEWLEF